MGVRAAEMGRLPIAKTIEKSSGAGREGHHLLGQSLRSANPLFAAPFGFGPRGRFIKFTIELTGPDPRCKLSGPPVTAVFASRPDPQGSRVNHPPNL